MKEFLDLMNRLGCMPEFIVATICLLAMIMLLVYGIVTLIKEIKECGE